MDYWGIGEDDGLFDKVHDIAVEFTKKVRPKYEKVYRKINRILQTDENGRTLPEVLPANKNKGNFKFNSIFESIVVFSICREILKMKEGMEMILVMMAVERDSDAIK